MNDSPVIKRTDPRAVRVKKWVAPELEDKSDEYWDTVEKSALRRG